MQNASMNGLRAPRLATALAVTTIAGASLLVGLPAVGQTLQQTVEAGVQRLTAGQSAAQRSAWRAKRAPQPWMDPAMPGSIWTTEGATRLGELLYQGAQTVAGAVDPSAPMQAPDPAIAQDREDYALCALEAHLDQMRSDALARIAAERLDAVRVVAERFGADRGTDAAEAAARGLQARLSQAAAEAEAHYRVVTGRPAAQLQQPLILQVPARAERALTAAAARMARSDSAEHRMVTAGHTIQATSVSSDLYIASVGGGGTRYMRAQGHTNSGGGVRLDLSETRGNRSAQSGYRDLRVAAGHDERIEERVTVGYAALNAAQSHLGPLRAAAASDDTLVARGLSAGGVSKRDLLAAIARRAERKIAAVNAAFAERFARYQILAAMGRLVSDLRFAKEDDNGAVAMLTR